LEHHILNTSAANLLQDVLCIDNGDYPCDSAGGFG
jgi:hypothetical protein